MFTIGVDPSLRSTGLVVLLDGTLVEKRTITTKSTVGDGRMLLRLRSIADDIQGTVMGIVSTGSEMTAAMELPIVYSAHPNMNLIGLNFILRDRFMDWGVPLLLVTPCSLKKFFSGKGNAEKEQMREAAETKWKFSDRSDDIIDAYALAKLSECLSGGLCPFGNLDDLNGIEKIMPYENAHI